MHKEIGQQFNSLSRLKSFVVFLNLSGYFPHIGRLNQLLVLCQQLEDDVQHLGSHKYIAHQLSVIYVSIKLHRLNVFNLLYYG